MKLAKNIAKLIGIIMINSVIVTSAVADHEPTDRNGCYRGEVFWEGDCWEREDVRELLTDRAQSKRSQQQWSNFVGEFNNVLQPIIDQKMEYLRQKERY